MYRLFPDKDVKCTRISISCRGGRHMPVLVVTPKIPRKNALGILWIHGGGYMTGMKEMVHMSRAIDLVKNYGARRTCNKTECSKTNRIQMGKRVIGSRVRHAYFVGRRTGYFCQRFTWRNRTGTMFE